MQRGGGTNWEYDCGKPDTQRVRSSNTLWTAKTHSLYRGQKGDSELWQAVALSNNLICGNQTLASIRFMTASSGESGDAISFWQVPTTLWIKRVAQVWQSGGVFLRASLGLNLIRSHHITVVKIPRELTGEGSFLRCPGRGRVAIGECTILPSWSHSATWLLVPHRHLYTKPAVRFIPQYMHCTAPVGHIYKVHNTNSSRVELVCY